MFRPQCFLAANQGRVGEAEKLGRISSVASK
jgi:hypothetical protein